MSNIKDYIRTKLSTEELIYTLCNIWEEDRGAIAEESVFDLHNKTDFLLWADMYSLDCAVACYNTARYWMGGANFATPKEREGNSFMAIIHSMTMDEKDLSWILGEIESRLDDYMEEYKEYGKSKKDCLLWYTEMYKNLIDFVAMDEDTHRYADIEKAVYEAYDWCNEFDGVDMEVNLEETIVNKDNNKVQFFSIACTEEGEACEYNYSAIKYNGEIYLPHGDRDEYPLTIEDVWKYQWTHKGDVKGIDREFNFISLERQKTLWQLDDMVGEDYLPSDFLPMNEWDNIALETDHIIETTQEITLQIWEDCRKDDKGFNDFFNQPREATFETCKEYAIEFLHIYFKHDWCEREFSYYDAIDNYLEFVKLNNGGKYFA